MHRLPRYSEPDQKVAPPQETRRGWADQRAPTHNMTSEFS